MLLWSSQHDRGFSQKPIEMVATSKLPCNHDPIDLKAYVLRERHDEEIDR
jgi:hypothetical protein